jgi:hypothetical protein
MRSSGMNPGGSSSPAHFIGSKASKDTPARSNGAHTDCTVDWNGPANRPHTLRGMTTTSIARM